MPLLLLVDDTPVLTELFADAIKERLGYDAVCVNRIDEVARQLAATPDVDVALVDMLFTHQDGSGLDVLAEIHSMSPKIRLVILTQGDEGVAQILRDAWELLPIATVISKTTPLRDQLATIELVARTGSAPLDPTVQPMLPAQKPPLRSIERFEYLVPHAGHAKLWRALMVRGLPATYKDVAEAAGLKLNTIKNYRASLLGELAQHGLDDPGLAEMQDFAQRCRAFLRPHVESALSRPR